MTTQRWNLLSAPVQTRFLRAMDDAFHPVQRLRCRSGTELAAVPSESAATLQVRARMIPQLLWPGWAIRLNPASAGQNARRFRAVIAACLMLPGNPVHALADALRGQYHGSRITVFYQLHELSADGNDALFAAVCHLADYLDQHGSPIDYERRREPRLSAIEQRVGTGPSTADLDEKITQMRVNKHLAVHFQAFYQWRSRRDRERKLLARKTARQKEWDAAHPDLATLTDQVQRLSSE